MVSCKEMRTPVLALGLGLVLSGTAFAEDAVGSVGLRSVDMPTASLAPLESALDRAISVHAPASRGKSATLGALAADPEIAKRRAEGRRAADAGANAMRQLELDTAQAEFDKAVTFLVSAHGDRLEPADLARIYTTRAKVAQMQRTPLLIKGEFEKAVPLHATKQLDPQTFPPDTIALFQQELREAAKAPLTPPGSAQLMDIARRTSLKWIVAGEARDLGPLGNRVSLAIVDAAGTAKSVEFVASSENLVGSFDQAVGRLFADAGVPKGIAAALTNDPTASVTPTPVPTAVAVSTPRPVPTQAIPRTTPAPPRNKRPVAGGGPWYKRWYVIAGVAVLAVGAGAAAASAGGGDTGGGGDDPDPPDEGITLVVDTP